MSTYIENISKEEEKKREAQLNDIIASLGMANASVAQQNEEDIRKREELLEKERLREIKEQEDKFFENRFKEEQERRIAFEEEVKKREEEEKKKKEEEERLKAERNKNRLYATKETIKNGVLKVGEFINTFKKDRELSPEDREKEKLDRKAASLRKKEAELKKYEKELKKRQEAEAAELKRQALEGTDNAPSGENTQKPEKKGLFSKKTKIKDKPDKVKVQEDTVPEKEEATARKGEINKEGAKKEQKDGSKISYQSVPEAKAPIANENDELRGVVKKRVQVKRKPQEKNVHGVRVYEPIDVDYTNIKSAGTETGVFVPPDGDGSYRVGRPTDEYITLKDKIKEIKQKTSMSALVSMIEDVTANRDRLIMIAVASNNMENLMLIRDVDKFLQYCEKMEDEICVSYIYAIYKGLGATYYLEKPEEELLTKIFSDIGILFATHQTINGTMLSAIPNIGIFKHIYI